MGEIVEMTEEQRQKKNLMAKIWRVKNQEKSRAMARKHYLKNAEKIKEKARLYRKNFPEKARQSARNSNSKYREKYLAAAKISSKIHYWENPIAARLRLRKAAQKQRAKVIMFLGGCCVRCGFTDFRALQIDHVRGGGTGELRLLGSRKYRKIYEDTQHSYQVLCANCNWIKRFENEEYGNVISRQPPRDPKTSS